MKTSDHILDAIQNLDRFGWIQGEYGSEKKGFCLLGALDHRAITIYDSTLDAVKQILGTPCTVKWNDTPGRTEQEVLEALEAAYVVALQDEGIELDEYFA